MEENGAAPTVLKMKPSFYWTLDQISEQLALLTCVVPLQSGAPFHLLSTKHTESSRCRQETIPVDRWHASVDIEHHETYV